MAHFYISVGDLPGAKISPDARLYAGCGWLSLVREVMAIIGDSEITAIREDAGALRIELARTTPEQRSALRAIEERSLQVCEICGDPGELRYAGMKNGRPAGWHRTRCEKHVNTRTLAGKPPLLDHIDGASSGLFIHVSDQENLLAQQMRDLQIHRHEIELARLKARAGDPLAAPFMRALEAIASAPEIVEAYITPEPIGLGRETGWSLVAFTERPLRVDQQVDLIVAAQEASDSVEITIEIFCWSDSAVELAEAMATGIRIWPALTDTRPRARLSKNIAQVRETLARYRATSPRVFGSVARGTDTTDSDIDLLIEPPAGFTLFDLAALGEELKSLLSVNVDIITYTQIPEGSREKIIKESVAL